MFNLISEAWDKYDGFYAVLAVIAIVIGFLGAAFGLMCLQAWMVMILWNWVAVTLFNVPTLTFWLSFGLIWLCQLMFKGLAKITITAN